MANRTKRHAVERDKYWADSEKARLPREEIEESGHWEPLAKLSFQHPETLEQEEITLANKLFLLRENVKPYMFLVYHRAERPVLLPDHARKEALLMPIVKAWSRSLHFEDRAHF